MLGYSGQRHSIIVYCNTCSACVTDRRFQSIMRSYYAQYHDTCVGHHRLLGRYQQHQFILYYLSDLSYLSCAKFGYLLCMGKRQHYRMLVY